MQTHITQLFQWLKDKTKILAVTHKKPDGDALGSLFGFAHLMNANGKIVHIHLEEELPVFYQNISSITNLKSKKYINQQVDICSYDGVITLDCARRDMPTVTNLFDIAQKHQIPTCSIDHHQDNDNFAVLNIVKPKAATASIVAEFAIEAKLNISADCANCLLLGTLRDTGGLRFQNTDPETLRLCASLIELGANYHDLIHRIFFSEPIARLKFISYIIENKLLFSENGRVAYTLLEDEEFEQFDIKKKDMEGLIDSIRVIDGVKITCMFTRTKDQVKLSLRSCDENFPVSSIAASIGGGGHILAAGARMQASSFQPAVAKFLKLTSEMFNA